jgi:hypothetical protein
LPQTDQGFLVLTHYDPGIGAADEVSAIRPVPQRTRISCHLRPPFGGLSSAASDRLIRFNRLMIQKGSYWMIQKGSTRIRLVSIEQLRAARGLLGWSQSELASRAGLSLPTVKRLEGGFGPRVSDEAHVRLTEAIEAAGIEFIEENGGGAGVRFRRAKRKTSES